MPFETAYLIVRQRRLTSGAQAGLMDVDEAIGGRCRPIEKILIQAAWNSRAIKDCLEHVADPENANNKSD